MPDSDIAPAASLDHLVGAGEQRNVDSGNADGVLRGFCTEVIRHVAKWDVTVLAVLALPRIIRLACAAMRACAGRTGLSSRLARRRIVLLTEEPEWR